MAALPSALFSNSGSLLERDSIRSLVIEDEVAGTRVTTIVRYSRTTLIGKFARAARNHVRGFRFSGS
ncbi:hypothetical protein A6U87_07675 [Rhizobium sp. AC44/96]|nr:hypothetical protein A6U87_07675 [Rhizobium sp. AC44/96]